MHNTYLLVQEQVSTWVKSTGVTLIRAPFQSSRGTSCAPRTTGGRHGRRANGKEEKKKMTTTTTTNKLKNLQRVHLKTYILI
jgi:hypothetical protein